MPPTSTFYWIILLLLFHILEYKHSHMVVEYWLQFWHSGEWRRFSDIEFPASAVPDEAYDRDGAVESTGDDGCSDDGLGRRTGSCREDVSGLHTRPLRHASCGSVDMAAHTTRIMSGHEYCHSRISGQQFSFILNGVFLCITARIWAFFSNVAMYIYLNIFVGE